MELLIPTEKISFVKGLSQNICDCGKPFSREPLLLICACPGCAAGFMPMPSSLRAAFGEELLLGKAIHIFP